MKHLNTRFCECKHEMTIYDKVGNLERNTQRNLYGGNVEAFSDAECPECQRRYKLWLRQHKNAWQVVTISSLDADEFDSMSRDELKAWLDGKGIEYTPQTGDKRLRELARSRQ